MTGPEHAHEISVGLQRLEAVEAVAPVVLELAGFVVGGVLDQRADRNAAELRAQLRGRADEIAEEVVAGGSGARTWSGAVTALRQMLGGDLWTTAMQIPRASDSGVKHVCEWAIHVVQKLPRGRGPSKPLPRRASTWMSGSQSLRAGFS